MVVKRGEDGKETRENKKAPTQRVREEVGDKEYSVEQE